MCKKDYEPGETVVPDGQKIAGEGITPPAKGTESKRESSDRIALLYQSLAKQQKAMDDFLEWNSGKGEQE